MEQQKHDLRGQADLDDAALAGLSHGMQEGGAQLPFATINAWATNGDRRFASQKDVSFYGGWNISAEGVDEMVQAGTLAVTPGEIPWHRLSKAGTRGDYEVYEARALHFAPICFRMSWLAKDGASRSPEYFADSRSHYQVLALMGIIPSARGGIQYVAPAVISVKGKGQTEALRTALNDWQKAIRPLLPAVNGKGLPPCAFWISVGTHGDQPHFVEIGGGSNKSAITPVMALGCKGLDADKLAKRFVGRDLLRTAAGLMADATEWVAAWRKSEQATGATVATVIRGADGEERFGDGSTIPPESEGPSDADDSEYL